jgi:tetratricopeptide (TPR) repeat protein
MAVLLLAVLGPPREVQSRARPTARPAPAARPTPAALRAARAHFRQGKAFYDAGVYADAIREYEKAYALAPLPELLFNIGQAHRMAGAKAQAIAAYERYLQAVPEGELADEARTHVAMLRSKIQLEEAEAARRKAEAEAAEAKRRVAEAEAARRRAEAEAAARQQAKSDDEVLLRRLAEQAAARDRERQARLARERQERLAAADLRGRTTRRMGVGLMLSGVVTLAVYGVVAGLGFRGQDRIRTFNDQPYAPWSSELESAASKDRPVFYSAIGLGSVGLALLVGGGIVYGIGKRNRTRAREAAQRYVEVVPSLGPGSAGLLVKGRF